jgi:hypothetical protein
MSVATKIGKVEPTEYPWSAKVTVTVGVDGLFVVVNTATAPPATTVAVAGVGTPITFLEKILYVFDPFCWHV